MDITLYRDNEGLNLKSSSGNENQVTNLKNSKKICGSHHRFPPKCHFQVPTRCLPSPQLSGERAKPGILFLSLSTGTWEPGLDCLLGKEATLAKSFLAAERRGACREALLTRPPPHPAQWGYCMCRYHSHCTTMRREPRTKAAVLTAGLRSWANQPGVCLSVGWSILPG